MKLFKYEDYIVVISEEALSIKPFRMIWNRDRSLNKEKAILELSYIYFMCDPRSDFSFLINLEDREIQIKEQIGLPIKWNPDKIVKEGMGTYEYLTQTTATLLLNDTKEAINKLRETLKLIDLNEVDIKGKPIYPLNMITNTIKQIPELVKNLTEAERSISKDIEESVRMRGQGSKKIFEDGIMI